MSTIKQAAAFMLAIARRYPARVISIVTAVVVFACARFGIVVSPESIGSAVALAVPILLGGQLIHMNVTPAK